jgi:DNA-binding CsgD family transcriptional regulator
MKSNLNKPSADQRKIQSILFNLHYKINKQEVRLEDIGDYIPGNVMVQDLGRLTNTYMNKKGCDILKKSTEELEALGPEYFSSFFPPEEIRLLKGELSNFVINNDPSATYSFFQRVRSDQNSPYKWYFTTTQFYPGPGNEPASQLMHIAIELNDCTYAARKASYICEQDQFVRKNFAQFNSLSKREKEIIKLIVDGNSSYNISSQLFISVHTVNNHRKNIVRKLNVKSLSELIRFATAFFII